VTRNTVAATFLRLTYRLPIALEEEWIAALWSAGTLGLSYLSASEEGEVRLEAWFDLPGPDLDEAGWSDRGLNREAREEIEARDWLANWRRLSRPRPAGQRFLLDPREPEEVSGEDPALGEASRILLRLPARNAFGAGSHETTRLAVELLENRASKGPVGATVLDVGTGTGVLAFAALALGARLAIGFDIDPVSPFQARTNSRLNATVVGDGKFVCFAGDAQALRAGQNYDLIVINVLPDRILPTLPNLVGRLVQGGELIFSGMVEEQVGEVVDHCARLGLMMIESRQEGEWVALTLVRSGLFEDGLFEGGLFETDSETETA